ncbi:MAG: helix-turn-helix domain-containing protein [Candidatus Methylomirabilis sp.]|nr:helix-turn-helix domain-containing protein [Deltaproteobacteria bacterium]
MEEHSVIDAGEKPCHGLDGANKTAIPDNSNMSPALSEAQAINKAPSFRRELLNELLSRKVMYEDIRTYKLSNTEVKHLCLCDIVTKREYLKLMQVIGFSRRAAYRKWRKAARECLKDFDYKPFQNQRMALLMSGAKAEADRLKAWLDIRCAGGIPTREIFRSITDYVVDLLGRVRDELYNKKTLRTKEVAKVLGVSTRHVRRLAQKGRLSKEGRGVFSREHIAEWKRDQGPLKEPN